MPESFFNRDSDTGVFLWILRKFEEHLFVERLRTQLLLMVIILSEVLIEFKAQLFMEVNGSFQNTGPWYNDMHKHMTS